MNILLILPILLGFFVTFLVLPLWIKKARKIALVWEDMNKFGKPRNVAGSGGLVVIMGFIISVLFYVAINTFVFKSYENSISIFSLTTSVLLLGGIGIIDDLLGWHHGGLSKKVRLVLCVFAAIPLMVTNAGNSYFGGLLLGNANFIWFYPLILIPIGIIGTSTTFNFLAGFNGLEASQGILIIGGLSLVAYFTGSAWLAVVGLCMIAALMAFLLFNFYPAKTFPGDVLTYPIGGLIAIMAILGNFEMIALFFFIPYIIEVGLKLRGGLKKQSFGKPNKDNTLDLAYEKIYGLEHLAIFILKKYKSHVYEKDVVFLINAFQILVILAGFIIFKSSIF